MRLPLPLETFIDTATFKVVGTVETGKGAHGIVIDPLSQYAYITNIYGNEVAVLDIAAQKVIAKVQTGAGPNGISFSSFAPAQAPSPQIEIMTEDEMQGMQP